MENDHAEETRFVNSLLVRGDDLPWVDYVRGIGFELDPTEYLQVLKRHAANIASNFDRSASEGVREKARWVANYHNQVVDELRPQTVRELGMEVQDLRLEEVPQRFEP